MMGFDRYHDSVQVGFNCGKGMGFGRSYTGNYSRAMLSRPLE